MDLEGTHAADDAQSVKGQGADGRGKPTGSSTPGPSDSDLKSLLTESARPPDPDSTLPARKDRPPAQKPFLLWQAEATRPPGSVRDAAREEREKAADQPDDRSALPARIETESGTAGEQTISLNLSQPAGQPYPAHPQRY